MSWNDEADDDYESFDNDHESHAAFDNRSDFLPCPECGEDIYADAVQCPACGWYVDWDAIPRTPRSDRWIKSGMLVLGAGLALYLLLFLLQRTAGR